MNAPTGWERRDTTLVERGLHFTQHAGKTFIPRNALFNGAVQIRPNQT